MTRALCEMEVGRGNVEAGTASDDSSGALIYWSTNSPDCLMKSVCCTSLKTLMYGGTQTIEVWKGSQQDVRGSSLRAEAFPGR